MTTQWRRNMITMPDPLPQAVLDKLPRDVALFAQACQWLDRTELVCLDNWRLMRAKAEGDWAQLRFSKTHTVLIPISLWRALSEGMRIGAIMDFVFRLSFEDAAQQIRQTFAMQRCR